MLALGLQTAVSGTAWAERGWYRHHGVSAHGHGHFKHRGARHHRHHHGGSDVAVGAAIVLGGLLVGALLARSWADPPPAYPVASPVTRSPVLGNCKPTTGRQLINGRWALLRGTWCTDQYGRGYILNDSVRFVRYLD